MVADLRLAVGRLSRGLRRIYGEARGADEPAFLELAILQRLQRIGPSTVTDLARGERVTTQAVSAIVTALQRRGLVDTAADPADRRRTVVRVNDAAGTLLATREERVTGRLAEVVAAVCTPAELLTLRDAAALLDRIADDL